MWLDHLLSREQNFGEILRKRTEPSNGVGLREQDEQVASELSISAVAKHYEVMCSGAIFDCTGTKYVNSHKTKFIPRSSTDEVYMVLGNILHINRGWELTSMFSDYFVFNAQSLNCTLKIA